jgi:hypothetical protein
MLTRTFVTAFLSSKERSLRADRREHPGGNSSEIVRSGFVSVVAIVQLAVIEHSSRQARDRIENRLR